MNTALFDESEEAIIPDSIETIVTAIQTRYALRDKTDRKAIIAIIGNTRGIMQDGRFIAVGIPDVYVPVCAEELQKNYPNLIREEDKRGLEEIIASRGNLNQKETIEGLTRIIKRLEEQVKYCKDKDKKRVSFLSRHIEYAKESIKNLT